MIKVLVADSQRLFADCLAIALQDNSEDLEVLDDRPNTTTQALDAVLLRKPDVALIDYRLTPEGGPKLAEQIRTWSQSTKLLLISWEHGPGYVDEALGAGAVGFLPTSLSVQQIVEGVYRANSGESPVYADQLKVLVETWRRRERVSAKGDERLANLTPRELQVLAELGAGHPIEVVAKRLSITKGTVNVHIHNILQKTRTRSYTEAIWAARRAGLLGQ